MKGRYKTMTKAINFINFIKENKLEEVEFAGGYDDNLCLTFSVTLDEEHSIDYEFYQKNGTVRIRLFTYIDNDDCDLETEEITSKKALELRGLAE